MRFPVRTRATNLHLMNSLGPVLPSIPCGWTAPTDSQAHSFLRHDGCNQVQVPRNENWLGRSNLARCVCERFCTLTIAKIWSIRSKTTMKWPLKGRQHCQLNCDEPHFAMCCQNWLSVFMGSPALLLWPMTKTIPEEKMEWQCNWSHCVEAEVQEVSQKCHFHQKCAHSCAIYVGSASFITRFGKRMNWNWLECADMWKQHFVVPADLMSCTKRCFWKAWLLEMMKSC